jgi:NADPH:quinone reductase
MVVTSGFRLYDNGPELGHSGEAFTMTPLPARMNAIAIRAPGGPEVLTEETQPVPSPGPEQILVKVAAAGLNRADVMQRMGLYPPPQGASDIPGLEIAGEVCARGSAVTRWRETDRVMALVDGGGYAQFCLAHESHALSVPAGLSLIEAGAIPEAAFTVWYNVFERGRLARGETVLIHGGSSGIGTTAIQLAKAFGARIVTTAGSPEKCAACRKLGADVAVNYKTEDFVTHTLKATGGRGADVVLDIIGGEYVDRNYAVAAIEGRILQVAVQSSARAGVDFRRLMFKRLTHTGSTLRARSVADKAAIARTVEANVLPLVASGGMRPIIDSTFPLSQAAAAHMRIESGQHFGKIVLTL